MQQPNVCLFLDGDHRIPCGRSARRTLTVVIDGRRSTERLCTMHAEIVEANAREHGYECQVADIVRTT